MTQDGNCFDYWLNTISRFDGSNAPVIVAITQCVPFTGDSIRPIDQAKLDCDKVLFECNEQEIAKHANQIHQANVRVTAMVDKCSAHVLEPVVKALRNAIEATMDDMPLFNHKEQGKVTKELPRLTELIEDAWKTKCVLSIHEFDKIRKEAGITDIDGVELEVLRTLGILFYFGRT